MSETQMSYRPCNRYPYRITVRAAGVEKKKIAALARSARVSASRYLVRLAVEGQAPPSEEERGDLRTLCFLLDRAGANLNQIAYKTNLAWMRGGKLPEEREIDQVVKGVKLLTQEIRKRLRRR